MKKIIFLAIGLLVQIASATVLEVNQAEEKVYFHPTPSLEASLLSLEDGTGYLMVSLDYDPKDTQNEQNTLQKQFENYQLQPITAESAAVSAILSIPEIDLKKEIILRNGQMGPYINIQVELKKGQVESLKKLKDQIQKTFNFEIQARSSFNSQNAIESYQVSPDTCGQLKVETVSDMINSLSQLKKPDGIKYPQTFDSLKASLLSSCFEVKPQTIGSFAELMKLSVATLNPNKVIVGRFTQKKLQDKVFGIKPNLKILIN